MIFRGYGLFYSAASDKRHFFAFSGQFPYWYFWRVSGSGINGNIVKRLCSAFEFLKLVDYPHVRSRNVFMPQNATKPPEVSSTFLSHGLPLFYVEIILHRLGDFPRKLFLIHLEREHPFGMYHL